MALTLQKAKEIHESDPYGILVEVGGDRETTKYLEMASGGLSNTLVASKTPHDKQFNRETYPTPTDKVDPRLIKEAKIASMLTVETNELFSKLGNNLKNKRPFIFANTAETHTASKQMGYAWIGLRMKFADGFYEFRLHTTLLRKRSMQQDDLGKIGINLIHSTMKISQSPGEHLHEILSSISEGIQKPHERIKINSFKLFKILSIFLKN